MMHDVEAKPFVLSNDEREAFVRDGYLLVREVFPRDVAADVAQQIIDVAAARGEPIDGPQPAGRSGYVLQQSLKEGPALDIITPRYTAAIDALCGAERTKPCVGVGYSVIRFPEPGRTWEPAGWHIDGIHFHHHIHSPEQGLIGLDLLTDVEPEGGGTAIRVGSHRITARILAAAEPDGLPHRELSSRVIDAIGDCPVVEAYGRAGDVLLMHPHLLHGSSVNTSERLRIAANRCVSLHAPMRFAREPGDPLSLVEQAVADEVRAAIA